MQRLGYATLVIVRKSRVRKRLRSTRDGYQSRNRSKATSGCRALRAIESSAWIFPLEVAAGFRCMLHGLQGCPNTQLQRDLKIPLEKTESM